MSTKSVSLLSHLGPFHRVIITHWILNKGRLTAVRMLQLLPSGQITENIKPKARKYTIPYCLTA